MQGFNMGRYHAPSSLDSALAATEQHKSKRSRTTPAAPPTVRFEMPFAIWCQTCPGHSNSRLIGQGVRFNARKTRVGAYHSTPIWSFELKHTACGGRIEIRTDPANHDFVVTEGARRRDLGDDAAVAQRTGGMLLDGGGMVRSREEEDREAARQDAFAALEGKKEKVNEDKTMAQRLEELRSVKERDWKDPDAANRRLRNNFRGIRRARDKDRERGESLADTMGFGFELLESSAADAQRAALVDFESARDDSGSLRAVAAKPLFGLQHTSSGARSSNSKIGGRLQSHLVSNTRAALDPFASAADPSPVKIRGVKRKDQPSVETHEQPQILRTSTTTRNTESAGEPSRTEHPAVKDLPRPLEQAPLGTLVAYDSD